jgi:hypothetical protein
MRSIVHNVALAGMVLVAVGCKKHLTADAIEKSAAAIVQQSDRGTSTWIVGPDGAVSAVLKDPSGTPVKGTVTGQVTFQGPEGTPQSVPVQYDPSTGVVTAAGPKLTADVTPVDYALTVDGKPWTGSLAVPITGTQELAENAKLNVVTPPPSVGPHGGVVQIVGPDRVELVANKGSGEMRAYVLDPNNQPIDPGDRTITVALQGDQPETVVLAPDPSAHFVVGRVRTRVDPINVTVAVREHGHTHACLVGWQPGAVVVVGPTAPRVHVMAVEAWPGEVVEVHGHGHHGEVVVGAPGVVVGAPAVVVGAPNVVVGAPGVVVGAPGVVVGAPGVVVGAPGAVVVGGPGHVNIHENVHVGGGGGGRHGR